MIGGADIIIKSSMEQEAALESARAAIKRFWPEMLVEDAETGDLVHNDGSAVGCTEIMLYRDADARESWARLGADPSNVNTLIHLFADPGEFTLVVDDPNAVEMASIIQA